MKTAPRLSWKSERHGGTPTVGGGGGLRPSWSQCPVRLQPENWRGTLILHLSTQTHNQYNRNTCTHKHTHAYKEITPQTLWPHLPPRRRTQRIMISLARLNAATGSVLLRWEFPPCGFLIVLFYKVEHRMHKRKQFIASQCSLHTKLHCVVQDFFFFFLPNTILFCQHKNTIPLVLVLAAPYFPPLLQMNKGGATSPTDLCGAGLKKEVLLLQWSMAFWRQRTPASSKMGKPQLQASLTLIETGKGRPGILRSSVS